ncbi:putative reverse transcriptase domain-containing protein [Tanacetum coccineum]
MNGKPHPFNRINGFVGLRRCIEKVEQVFEIYKCAEEDKVMFAASTFKGHTLTWWNGNVHTLGLVNANRIPWTEFKLMMTIEYCPATEIQRMEEELWTLTLKGDDIEAYNNHFHELALMCPELVPNEKKKIERYIRGFPERIKGNITSLRPTTLHDAINMARELVEQAIQGKAARETARAYAAAPAEGRGYNGNLPWCYRCKVHHHQGLCPPKCGRCNKLGYQEKDCQVRIPSTGGNALQDVTCFGCGEKGHYRHKCPKGRNQQNKGARARAYVVVENPQQNPNVVTGMFLLNDHYASVLFDLDAERSFVSTEFTPFIDISPTTLNTSYEVELADGKVVSTNIILRGCTLALFNHVFKIDLLPTRLGSFDVIIGMDWLSYHRAVIVCYEKIIRIPLLNGEILEIQGERSEKDPRSLSCIKADETKLDDIHIVRDFPEVFPDDLTG